MGTRTPAGAWNIDFPGVSGKAPAGHFTRCPLNLNSHNHNQHAGRPCFSLAVLIEHPTSTPRYDISRLRKCASHLSAHAIHAHADCSPLHRNDGRTVVRPLQTERSVGDADDNRTALYAPPTARFTELDLSVSLSIFINCGSTTDVAELRICAKSGHEWPWERFMSLFAAKGQGSVTWKKGSSASLLVNACRRVVCTSVSMPSPPAGRLATTTVTSRPRETLKQKRSLLRAFDRI